MLKYLFKILEQFRIDQDILQVIGMAFLTVLISIAIAIFGGKKEFEILDRNVVLDHVVRAKFFLFYLGLIFLPLLFWNISSAWFRLFEIILWFIGICLISKILINSYHWMKGNQFILRFNYLKNIKNNKDLEASWYSVWKSENINPLNERKFFEIFSNTIEKILKKSGNENLTTISKLFSDFDKFLENRTVIFLVWPEWALTKILDWHFKMWKKYIQDELSDYREIFMTLDSSLGKIEKRVLNEGGSIYFFKTFKEHAEKYKGEFVEGRDKSGKYYYIESLFKIFYNVFFENIKSSPENNIIWIECFPKEWKITKSNLTNKENIISRITVNAFLIWAQKRIEKAEENADWDLEDISRNIFPEVDPILWARILIFVLSPYDGENKVKSVIERPWNFGIMGRLRWYPDYPEENEEEFSRKVDSARKIEENSTFELAYLLFHKYFSKRNLEEYIKNLKELKYVKASKEEYRRVTLLNIFEKMLKYSEPCSDLNINN